MNCLCNPPKLAVIKTSQRPNENYAKEFFGCASGGCNFFSWLGASIPASFQNVNHAPKRSPKKSSSVPQMAIRLAFTKFDDGPPVKIWFGVFHSNNSKLTQLYLSFPREKREYVESTRSWIFDFSLYEEFLNHLQSSEYEFVDVMELPRFLIVGLKRYTDKMQKHQQRMSEELTRLGLLDEEFPLNIETSLLDLLLPFQLEGIKYVIRHAGKALIGDDMVRNSVNCVADVCNEVQSTDYFFCC